MSNLPSLTSSVKCAPAVFNSSATILALAFSSLTTESRYATFGWFATWVLGWVAYASLSANLPGSWDLVSLYHMLGLVQSWVFGIETHFSKALPAVGLLVGLTVATFVILFRQISAPIRV